MQQPALRGEGPFEEPPDTSSVRVGPTHVRQFKIWSEPRGWRWVCNTCPPHRGNRLVGGLNKWLVPWYGKDQKLDHPRVRCLRAIELHCWKYHRED